jgi:Skp family chaperone for outer membrane proteins
MKKMILLVAMLILVAFVTGAMAQQKPAPAKPATTVAPAAPAPAKPEAPAKLEKFSGVIEKVDEIAKAIEVKGKVKKEEKTLAFATDDKTKITKARKALPFADLKKGMSVSVEYKKDGDKMIAVTIKVSAPKAAPKEAPKKAEEKPAEAPKK